MKHYTYDSREELADRWAAWQDLDWYLKPFAICALGGLLPLVLFVYWLAEIRLLDWFVQAGADLQLTPEEYAKKYQRTGGTHVTTKSNSTTSD